MEVQNNSNNSEVVTTMNPYKKFEFDQYLTFRALGGIITTDDGEIKYMTQKDFCETYKTNVATIWHWRQSIPNLADLIRERREEVMPLSRETKMMNQLYLLGLQSHDKRAAVDAIKTWLGHFAGLRLPQQAVKVEAGASWAAMLEGHQKNHEDAIEGETIDDKSISTQS